MSVNFAPNQVAEARILADRAMAVYAAASDAVTASFDRHDSAGIVAGRIIEEDAALAYAIANGRLAAMEQMAMDAADEPTSETVALIAFNKECQENGDDAKWTGWSYLTSSYRL